jgi:hypothetical protein
MRISLGKSTFTSTPTLAPEELLDDELLDEELLEDELLDELLEALPLEELLDDELEELLEDELELELVPLQPASSPARMANARVKVFIFCTFN